MAPVPLTTLWGLLGKGNLFILSSCRLSVSLTLHTHAHIHTLHTLIMPSKMYDFFDCLRFTCQKFIYFTQIYTSVAVALIPVVG